MKMSGDTAKLQKAIFAHLASDTVLSGLTGGSKIYDRPIENIALPYLTFGVTRAVNVGTASEDAQEHLFTVHAWSRQGGRKEAMSLMSALQARLDTLATLHDGMRIVHLRCQSEDITYNEQVRAYQGTVRYRAITEADAL
jgi:hypothetical protein